MVERAAPEVGAADAAREESVAGEKLRLAKNGVFVVGGQVERDTAGSVTGSVDDVSEKIAPLQDVAFLEELVDFDEFGSGHTDESSLHFHAAVEGEIIAVHHDGSTGVLVELGEAADVVDVSVGADDGLDVELVATEKTEDAFDFIAGIDDDGFQGAGVADDGAVALEHADGDLEVDHFRVGSVRKAVAGVGRVHKEKYIIGLLAHHSRRMPRARRMLTAGVC